MTRGWGYGRKLGVGFAATVLLTFAISVTAVVALRAIVYAHQELVDRYARSLVEIKTVATASDRKTSAMRGFLLAGQDRYLDEMNGARTELTASLGRLAARVGEGAGARHVARIERLEEAHQRAAERVIGLRRGETSAEDVARAFDEEVAPRRAELLEALEALTAEQERFLDEAQHEARAQAARTSAIVIVLTAAAALTAALIAIVLTRSLAQRIGSAVGQVQTSSAELQAAAAQQASGAREQATAMNEIATTMTELLATSRQIADGARRVAAVAEDTATAAGTGGGTVGRANEAIVDIRRQTDQMVRQVVDLGRRSAQIGSVLELVSELAEQTNILAINATIEAAGAGEAGRRFGVVADEIRKLADRVGGGAKEIRRLIDDVQGAVNSAVMGTEAGSKTVTAAAEHFAEVAAAFERIAGLVASTTEAAREIELSTKQQTTAVEQVNVAIASTTQATRETEASSAQTLGTASQLASLSEELGRLLRPSGA